MPSMYSFRTISCSFFLCISIVTSSAADTSPLLDTVYRLQCATSQQSAKTALKELSAVPRSLSGLPNENLTPVNDALYAGSLDITLDVLLRTSKKYTELNPLVEKTLLTWNFCEIFQGGEFYDQKADRSLQQANYLPPLKWQGFRKLGFFEAPATFIPKLLSNPPIGKQAFEMFFHRIYRKQCFPHPTTGELYHRQRSPISQRLSLGDIKHNTLYPFTWNSSCPVKKKTKPTIKQPLIEVKPKEKLELTHAELTEKPIEDPAIKSKEVKVLVKEIHQEAQEETKKEVIIPPAENTTHYNKTDTAKHNKLAKKTAKKIPKKERFAFLPTKKEIATPIAIAPSSSSSTPISVVISTNPENTHGFTGNVYFKQRLSTNKPTIGINASWKPIADSYWFTRFNIDYDYTIDDPLSYAWGLGYDDWHKGTWSAQINNWGPIKRGDGLAFDKAIANVGYKFKLEKLEKYNLHANTSLDIPMKGDPALNLGMQWTPKENWYIRANINQPLNGDEPTWSYGFGYSNWRANKFNVEYANYGTNALFEPNFRKNGIINVSYNWEF